MRKLMNNFFVNFFAVAYSERHYYQFILINFTNYSIITYAKAPQLFFCRNQFGCQNKWVGICQYPVIKIIQDSALNVFRQLFKLFFSILLDRKLPNFKHALSQVLCANLPLKCFDTLKQGSFYNLSYLLRNHANLQAFQAAERWLKRKDLYHGYEKFLARVFQYPQEYQVAQVSPLKSFLKHITKIAIIVIISFSALLQAKDLGTFGEVFTIAEADLLEVIQEKLNHLEASGGLREHQEKIATRSRESIERPKAVAGITHTNKPRTFTYDPSITLTSDIADHEGRVFATKGERINPLNYRSMTKPLLFIDGDAGEHLTWAFSQLKAYPQAKIILVKGSPLKIMQDMGIQVYFDQFGKITNKLGIVQVPAKVTQAGDYLQIEEVKADIEALVESRHQTMLSSQKGDR